MAQCFEDLPGVETDIDDIIVWGTSKEDHDRKLKNVLKRCQEINLTLNLEKMPVWTNSRVLRGTHVDIIRY
jgi:hypothetical protein